MANYTDIKKYVEQTQSVSLQDDARTLRKFGRGTCWAKETRTMLMTQGSSPIAVETLTTANLVDTLSSTGANTATLGVQGFTVDTSGDLDFVEQDATMSGTTGVTLGTPVNTVTRMYVKEGTFASPSSVVAVNVYASESTNTGLTAGLPSTIVYCKAVMSASVNQTEKALTCTARNEYAAIMAVEASLPEGASPTGTAAADIKLEVKRKGGVFRPAGLEAAVGAQQRHVVVEFDPPEIVPPNSYFCLTAKASTVDLVVGGTISGVIFRTQGT